MDVLSYHPLNTEYSIVTLRRSIRFRPSTLQIVPLCVDCYLRTDHVDSVKEMSTKKSAALTSCRRPLRSRAFD